MQDNNIKHKEHDKKQTLYEDLPYLNIGILISVIFHIFFIYIRRSEYLSDCFIAFNW